ncbi:MAG: hypothetical protein Q9162_000227 [Coniocarpon cinnabarinum]
MSPYARVMRSFRPLLSTVPRRRLQLCAARFAGKEDALPPPPLGSTPPSYTDLSILPSTTGSTPRTAISHTQPRPQPLSPHSPD